MTTQTVNFPESTNSSPSQTVTLANLKSVTSVTVNTGSVTYSVSGNNVTINCSGGAYTRYTTSTYYPTTTKTDSRSTSAGGSASILPSSVSYNDGTYSGTLNASGSATVTSGSAAGTKYVSPSKGGTVNQNWVGDGSQWQPSGNAFPTDTSYSYSDSDGYSGSVPWSSVAGAPPPPGGTPYNGNTASTYVMGTVNYYGTVSKPDTRVWTQNYSGTVTAINPSYSYTYYYAYTATVNYTEYQPPTAPTITSPTTGTVISSSPSTITWTAGSDLETATSALKYEIGLSLDGGTTYSSVISLTAAGVTSYSYDFLQNSDTTQAKLRMRTYDGSMYSPYAYSSLFTITHNLPPTITMTIDGNSVNNNATYLVSDTNNLNFSFVPTDSAGDTIQYSVVLRGVTKIPYTACTNGGTVNFTILNTDLLMGNNIVLIKVMDNHNAENIYTITLRNKTSQTVSQHDVLSLLQSLGYSNSKSTDLQDLKPSGYTGNLSLSDIINFLK